MWPGYEVCAHLTHAFTSACLPPSISLASLAASSAFPQEFLLISEIVSGANLRGRENRSHRVADKPFHSFVKLTFPHPSVSRLADRLEGLWISVEEEVFGSLVGRNSS